MRFLPAFLAFCALYKTPGSTAQLIQAAPERCFIFSDAKARGCRSERTLGTRLLPLEQGITSYSKQQLLYKWFNVSIVAKILEKVGASIVSGN